MIGVLGLVLSALFFYLASLTTSVPWYMIATTVQGEFPDRNSYVLCGAHLAFVICRRHCRGHAVNVNRQRCTCLLLLFLRMFRVLIVFMAHQDGAITDAQKGAAFGAYAGATLIVLVVVVVIVTLVVVMPNPYNYQPFYLILFSLSVLLLGHTWSYYPETATMRKVRCFLHVCAPLFAPLSGSRILRSHGTK